MLSYGFTFKLGLTIISFYFKLTDEQINYLNILSKSSPSHKLEFIM